MKLKNAIMTVLMATAINVKAIGTNDNLWVVISPNLNENQMHAFCESEVNWLLKAPENTRVRFMDAESLQTIADMKIPAVENSKGRVMALQSGVQRLVTWARSAISDHAATDGRVDLPGVLRSIASEATRSTSVLIVGSPIYKSDEKGFDFFVPTEPNPDARYRRPAHCEVFATPEDSPFGTRGIGSELGAGDVEVLWLIPDQASLGPLLYQMELQNFWAIYVQQVGGSLVDWGSDTSRMLNKVLDSNQTPFSTQVHNNELTFEMISTARESGTNTLKVRTAPTMVLMDQAMPITDFILVDRTDTMLPRLELVKEKIRELPQKVQKHYALIYFDDHDFSPNGAELAIAGATVQQIADKLVMRTPFHPHHAKTYVDALEDAVGLAENMIHEQHLRSVNLYIFSDSASHSDCPLGFNYETEAKELMAEGHSIYIADLNVPIKNNIKGIHLF